MRRVSRENWLVAASQAGIVVAIAAGWEAIGRSGWVDPEVLPPLSKVLTVLWGLLHQPSFLSDLRITFAEVVTAFAISVPFGLLIGFIVGERRWLYRVVNPTIQLLMATPKAIFLPLFIIALGIGFVERVMFATMIGLFAVILSGIAAVHSVPQGLVTAARSLGAARWQLYLQIYIPAMAPLIIGGIRLGLTFTIFGVLLSEMYASSNGIGHALVAWGEAYRLAELLAGVLLVVLVTVVLNELIRLCEMRGSKRNQVGT
jgi:NitT/TauT family transport system permease protein